MSCWTISFNSALARAAMVPSHSTSDRRGCANSARIDVASALSKPVSVELAVRRRSCLSFSVAPLVRTLVPIIETTSCPSSPPRRTRQRRQRDAHPHAEISLALLAIRCDAHPAPPR